MENAPKKVHFFVPQVWFYRKSVFLSGEIYRKSVFLQNWSMIELNE